MNKMPEYQLQKYFYMCLLIAADAAVGILGKRIQVVLYYAWQIPWILRLISAELGGTSIKVTVLDSNGEEVFGTSSAIKKQLSKLSKVVTSIFTLAAFVGALLAAGTDRRLAMLMIAGQMAHTMFEDCETQEWYHQFDDFFDDHKPFEQEHSNDKETKESDDD